MLSANKKILIVSMKAGFGHLKAGQALTDYAQTFLPSITAEHVDISQIDPSFKKYAKMYDWMVKHFPSLWAISYSLFNVPAVSRVAKRLNLLSYFVHPGIKKYIQKSKPDILLFTNVVPLPLFAFAFRKMFPHIKMGVVVTDYHGHAYYHFSSIDYYFVPSPEVRQDLLLHGTDAKKIIVSGMPIGQEFFEKHDISRLKRIYGLNPDLPVVLMIASFQISKGELVRLTRKILDQKKKVHLIVLVNNKKDLYEVLEKHFADRDNFTLVKWTEAMVEYMNMADVVITKAGGLTSSECLVLQKPMIMFRPTPGQEEYNASFMEKSRLGLRAKKIKDIVFCLPEALKKSRRGVAQETISTNPSKQIFSVLIND